MYKKLTYVIRLLKSQSLPISILKHIAQDILHFILTSTRLRNFFSGEEGDLPVGFPDRFNSSFNTDWFEMRVKGIYMGPCKVRNETETKRNETKQVETKRNKSKRNETDRNETKQIETKRNKTKRNETNDMARHRGQKSVFSNIRKSFSNIRNRSFNIRKLISNIRNIISYIRK